MASVFDNIWARTCLSLKDWTKMIDSVCINWTEFTFVNSHNWHFRCLLSSLCHTADFARQNEVLVSQDKMTVILEVTVSDYSRQPWSILLFLAVSVFRGGGAERECCHHSPLTTLRVIGWQVKPAQSIRYSALTWLSLIESQMSVI